LDRKAAALSKDLLALFPCMLEAAV
jgi:hypothetical protein